MVVLCSSPPPMGEEHTVYLPLWKSQICPPVEISNKFHRWYVIQGAPELGASPRGPGSAAAGEGGAVSPLPADLWRSRGTLQSFGTRHPGRAREQSTEHGPGVLRPGVRFRYILSRKC